MRTGSIPIPTADSIEFWAGCLDEQLLMPVCQTCGEINWFPRAMCRNCSGVDLEWQRMSGDAVIYSFTIVSQPSATKGDESFVLALVDLVEEVRMMTHIRDIEFDQITVGMPVQVRFEKISEEIALPIFVPAVSENSSR